MRIFVLAATLMFAEVATAQSRDGVYEMVARDPTPRRGARIRPSRAVIRSIQNDNQRYSLAVVWPSADCAETLLALGRRIIPNDFHRSEGGSCAAFFALTRADADRAARGLRVTRQDRAPIGEAVTASFAASRSRVRAGEPIEIVVTLTNPAGAPVVRFERGPAPQPGMGDGHFSYVIERDGRPVEPATLVYAASTHYELLARGGSIVIRYPLSRLDHITDPGRYVVRCRYETTMTLDGTDPSDLVDPGAAWERVFEGEARFEVR